MGGCATKPKVLKGDAAKAPLPLHDDDDKQLQQPHKPQLPLIVDDDSSNKRNSLSSLFTQNEDGKVTSENEKVAVSTEGMATEEKPEAVKPSEVGKCHGGITEEVAEKTSEEIKSNEPIKEEPQQMNEEKPSGESQSQSQSSEVSKKESAVAVVEKPLGVTVSNEFIKGDSGESENESKKVIIAESEDAAVEKISGETETENKEVTKAESADELVEKDSGETENNEVVKGECTEDVAAEKISRETETESNTEALLEQSSEESESKGKKEESAEAEMVVAGAAEKIPGETEISEVSKREENQNKETAEERKQEILAAEKPEEKVQKGGEAEEGREKKSSGEDESNDRVKQESSETEVEEIAEKVIQVVEEATVTKIQGKSQRAAKEAEAAEEAKGGH